MLIIFVFVCTNTKINNNFGVLSLANQWNSKQRILIQMFLSEQWAEKIKNELKFGNRSEMSQ